MIDNDESSEQSASMQSPSWLSKVTHSIFGPKKLDDLLDVIALAAESETIDYQTKAMIQGVSNVSNQQVRDVMIFLFRFKNFYNRTLNRRQ